jgi:hypothetical protein
MSRLAPIHPKDMTEEQLDYFHSVRNRPANAGKPDDEPLSGPFAAWQRSPVFGHLLSACSKRLRSDGFLERRIVELVIISIVRLWSAKFPFTTHANWAVEAGIDPASSKRYAVTRRRFLRKPTRKQPIILPAN